MILLLLYEVLSLCFAQQLPPSRGKEKCWGQFSEHDPLAENESPCYWIGFSQGTTKN